MEQDFRRVAAELAALSRYFHGRGWALGTSGNFSAVLSRDPLRLGVTPSAVDKGELSAGQILQIGARAEVLTGGWSGSDGGDGRPSAESLIHVEIARARGAGAILHTHSVWSTILSERHAAQGGLAIEGYEMLKGLEGVRTHEHREWIPIIDNAQDAELLSQRAGQALDAHPAAHAFLIRRHGLYTWGEDLRQAKRHVEILEFLLEAVGRARLLEAGGA